MYFPAGFVLWLGIFALRLVFRAASILARLVLYYFVTSSDTTTPFVQMNIFGPCPPCSTVSLSALRHQRSQPSNHTISVSDVEQFPRSLSPLTLEPSCGDQVLSGDPTVRKCYRSAIHEEFISLFFFFVKQITQLLAATNLCRCFFHCQNLESAFFSLFVVFRYPGISPIFSCIFEITSLRRTTIM